MSAVTSVVPLAPGQRLVVERLWQLYAHDLSEFRGWLPDEAGLYPPGRLPAYLGDPDRCCYLIRRDSAVGGFALVRGLTEEPRVLGEFFVVRAARRRVATDAVGTAWSEERRPVPDKPEAPPDTWLMLDTGPPTL